MDQSGRQLQPVAENFNAIVLSHALQDDTCLLTNKDVDVIQRDIENVFDNFINTMNATCNHGVLVRPVTEDDILINKVRSPFGLYYPTELVALSVILILFFDTKSHLVALSVILYRKRES